MIEKNRNPAGRLGNMLFGIAQVTDGLVRILSCGFLHTRFPLEVSKRQTKIAFKRLQQKGFNLQRRTK